MGRPGNAFRAVEQRERGGDLSGSQVDPIARPMSDRSGSARRGPDLDRKDFRRHQVARRGQFLPATDFGVMDASKVDRRSTAPSYPFGRSFVALESANPDQAPFRKPLHLLADADRSRG